MFKRKKKYARTVFLAILATVTFGYIAVDSFDVAPAELFEFLIMSITVMLMAMILGAITGYLLAKFRGWASYCKRT